MKMQFWGGLAACLVSAMLVGCGASSQVIRGQSPANLEQLAAEQGVQSTIHADADNTVQPVIQPVCRKCRDCQYDYQTAGAGEYGNGMTGNDCYGNCYGDYCQGYGWAPIHVHKFKEKRPNLVYPQTNAPAGMVMYPYYTVRGPSDFFMK